MVELAPEVDLAGRGQRDLRILRGTAGHAFGCDQRPTKGAVVATFIADFQADTAEVKG